MSSEKNSLALCHTTPRLDALKGILKGVRSFADIGCDHAYLPILLAREGGFEKIIASDINEGPVLKARANIERFGLCEKIEVRRGNGLSTLEEGEVDAVVISGMGADVICNILRADEKTARSVKFAVLQPMSGAEDLRRYLYTNDYIIKKEVLVREDRRIYPIMVVESGKCGSFDEFDCYVSRALRESGSVFFDDYFARQKRRVVRARDGLQRAKKPDIKLHLYENLLREFESVERGLTDCEM